MSKVNHKRKCQKILYSITLSALCQVGNFSNHKITDRDGWPFKVDWGAVNWRDYLTQIQFFLRENEDYPFIWVLEKENWTNKLLILSPPPPSPLTPCLSSFPPLFKTIFFKSIILCFGKHLFCLLPPHLRRLGSLRPGCSAGWSARRSHPHRWTCPGSRWWRSTPSGCLQNTRLEYLYSCRQH